MREFLFEYRFGGSEWGVTVHADDPAQAMEKVRAMVGARYKGEVAATIPVPGGTLIQRVIAWLKS